MEVRNSSLNGNLDGISVSLGANLGSVLNVSEPASSSSYGQTEGTGSASDVSWLEPDWATLSTVGSTVSETVAQGAAARVCVRTRWLRCARRLPRAHTALRPRR